MWELIVVTAIDCVELRDVSFETIFRSWAGTIFGKVIRMTGKVSKINDLRIRYSYCAACLSHRFYRVPL
jgi:hypothetical protein